jgi:hypothetical protein
MPTKRKRGKRKVKVSELFEDLQGQKQKRLEFLLKTYENSWKGVPGFEKKDLKKFIEYVGEKIDPSHNGAYMQWIVSRVVKDPHENKPEDLERLKSDILEFEKHKSEIQNKDINSYKTFYQLFQVVDPFLKRAPTADEKEEEKEKKIKKEGIVDVYNGPEGWIKIPTTKEASCILGRNTRWCTAAERSANMFHTYNKRDWLLIIYDKHTKKRLQLHIQDGALADETDRHMGMDKLPEWARQPIIDWYKKNQKKLGLKHIFTFAGMGDTEAAKGTPHEEVVELMKKYGVV